ncbi:hypothetical protein ACWFRF_15580 [Nocardia sp. NPDC055165]
MADQYKCQSYYDDNNVIQDCTCGKCANPNEVMDVEDILKAFAIKTHEATPGEDETPNFEEAANAIDAHVAQQNAALLRELLTHKEYVKNTQPPRYTVDASILEAKLNEITEEVKT